MEDSMPISQAIAEAAHAPATTPQKSLDDPRFMPNRLRTRQSSVAVPPVASRGVAMLCHGARSERGGQRGGESLVRKTAGCRPVWGSR